MRKAVLLILIALVTAGIGLVLYMEFGQQTLTYCGKNGEILTDGYSYVGRNMYYSGVDQTEVKVALDTISDGDLAGETVLEAALAKGKPVFYPSFYIDLIRPDTNSGYFEINGEIVAEYMEGQAEEGYRCHDLQLNVYTSNISILAMNNEIPTELVQKPYTQPVISEDKVEGVMKFENATTYDIYFAMQNGKTNGTITFEWVYAVTNENLLNPSSLNEQSLVVDVTISNNNGVISATFA